MIQRIQIRRGTAAQWTSANPILASGEQGLETDTRQTKIGDGSTAWNALAYAGGGETTESVLALLEGKPQTIGSLTHDGSEDNPTRYTLLRSRQFHRVTGEEVGGLRIQTSTGGAGQEADTEKYSSMLFTHNFDHEIGQKDIPDMPGARLGYECLWGPNSENHPYGNTYELNFDLYPANGTGVTRWVNGNFDVNSGLSYWSFPGSGEYRSVSVTGEGDFGVPWLDGYAMNVAARVRLKGGSSSAKPLGILISTDSPQSFAINPDMLTGPVTSDGFLQATFTSSVVTGSPLLVPISLNTSHKDNFAVAHQIMDALQQVPAITAHWNFKRVGGQIIVTRNTVAAVDLAASITWPAAFGVFAGNSYPLTTPAVNNSRVELEGSSLHGSPKFGFGMDRAATGSKDGHIYNASGDLAKFREADKGIEIPGDLQINDATKGLVLTSPDGNKWRFSVNNAGVVSTTSLPLDADAQFYITAIETAKGSPITDTQKYAINSFVLLEKASPRWAKHKRIHFPIWQNAAANLIDLKAGGSGSLSGSFTHSNGKMVPASGTSYFNLGTTPSALGLTNTTKFATWLLQVDANADAGQYPLGCYNAGTTEIGFQTTTGNSVIFMANVYTTLDPDDVGVARKGLFFGSYDAGAYYGKFQSGSAARVTIANVSSAVFVPPTVNLFAYAVNANGTPSGYIDEGLGGFGIAEGMTQAEADGFIDNFKTLWTACTGLVFP